MPGLLTRRLLLVLLIGLIAVFVSQSLARTYLELPTLLRLEGQLDVREVGRARNALQQRLDELIMISADYSVWDDTYAFMASTPGEAGFEDYLRSNLVYSTHENNGINGFVFLNGDGAVHHFTSYDIHTGELLGIQPLSGDELEGVVLAPRAVPGHEDRRELVNAGFLESKLGPLLFSAVEIRPSEGDGARRGTMVTWRRVGSPLFDTLRQQLEISLTVFPADVARSDPSLRTRLEALTSRQAGATLPRDDGNNLYWLIRSVDTQPMFLVRQAAPERLIGPHWLSTSFLVGFGASALVMLVVAFAFSRWVTSPLVRASKVINEITEGGDLSTRLETGSQGELDQLLGFINHLLGRIQVQEEELRSQNRRLENLSYQDALTGIANRRQFDEDLARVWDQARLEQRPVSLCLVDIDCFKRYNDNYGHQRGDEVLRQVADCLASNLHSSTDLVARFGGEEFCVLMRDTDHPSAFQVAERLRAAVEAMQIPHDHSTVLARLTVSAGVTTAVPGDEGTCEEFLGLADQALYEAKRKGRNRVCVGPAVHLVESRPCS